MSYNIIKDKIEAWRRNLVREYIRPLVVFHAQSNSGITLLLTYLTGVENDLIEKCN